MAQATLRLAAVVTPDRYGNLAGDSASARLLVSGQPI